MNVVINWVTSGIMGPTIIPKRRFSLTSSLCEAYRVEDLGYVSASESTFNYGNGIFAANLIGHWIYLFCNFCLSFWGDLILRVQLYVLYRSSHEWTNQEIHTWHPYSPATTTDIWLLSGQSLLSSFFFFFFSFILFR